MRRTSRASVPETSCALRNLRLRFADFFSRLWLFIAWRRRSFPAPLTLKRFFAALDVFCFGISRHSCVLRRPQHHDHVPPVEEGRRFDDSELLDILRQPHQQVTAPLRMAGLPAPEHDRDLDLRALVEEAHNVALLGLVILGRDLRPELDLLDVYL